MKRLLLAASFSVLISGAGMGASLGLKGLPGDSKWLVRLDAQRLMHTRLGETVRELAAREEAATKLAAIEAMFSVNLLRDIHGMTLCGVSARSETAVFYLRGTFDQQKLVTILRAADGHSESDYRGHMIHLLPGNKAKAKKPSYGCFARADLIVTSESEQTLRRALDVLAGRRDSLADVRAFSEWTDVQGSFIFMAAAKGIRDIRGVHPKAAMLKRIEDMIFSLDQREGKVVATLAVTADTEESSNMLRQTLKGLQAFALLNAAAKPKLAEIAEKLNIRSAGRTLRVSLAVPVEDVQRAILEGAKQNELKKRKP